MCALLSLCILHTLSDWRLETREGKEKRKKSVWLALDDGQTNELYENKPQKSVQALCLRVDLPRLNRTNFTRSSSSDSFYGPFLWFLVDGPLCAALFRGGIHRHFCDRQSHAMILFSPVAQYFGLQIGKVMTVLAGARLARVNVYMIPLSGSPSAVFSVSF